MATEVTFNPQGTPLGPTEAFYRGMDQSISMMERSQALKRQKLAQQLDEQKLAQWQVEAPLRDLQVQTNMAEAGTKLYATQDTLTSTRDLEQNSPQIIQMMKDADIIENDSEGDPKYDSNFVKWGKVVSTLSPYSNTAKGKSMLEAAKAQQMNYRMSYANVLDFKEKKLLKQQRIQAMSQKPERPVTPQDITDLQEAGVDTSGMQMNNTYRLTYDPATGKPIAWSQPSMINRTATEQGGVAFEKQFNEELAKQTTETNKNTQLASQAADSLLVDIDTLEGLYESGLQTGAGNEYLNMFGATALRLGIGSSDRMATQEQAQQAFADMKLRAATVMLKGQGQVTEAERAMVEDAVAKAGNSPAANMAIMKVLRKAAERAKEAAKYNNQLRRQAARGEIKAQEIQILMDEWYSQHSIGADALSSIIAREARNGGGDTGTGPTGTPTSTSRDETGEQLYNRLLSGGKK